MDTPPEDPRPEPRSACAPPPARDRPHAAQGLARLPAPALAGSFTSELGYQFARIAIYVQLTELTRSAAAVGLFGLISLIALFIGTLVGGSFIDAHDRRTTLAWAQVAHTLSAGILLAGALYGRPPVGLIYGAGALHAFVGSIDQPTRSAMAPRLVGAHLVASSVALNQVMWQTIGIVGPALAGIVIARAGYGLAYGIDLVTYGALFAAALLMRPMPPEHDPDSASGWDAVKEGFRYVRRDRLISSTFVIDLIAMIFGMPRRAVHVPRLHAVPSRPRGRRAAVRRACGRRAPGGVDGRLGQIRPPTRARRHLGGSGVGGRDRRVRVRSVRTFRSRCSSWRSPARPT